jgi:predicted metal-dependent hydrolase
MARSFFNRYTQQMAVSNPDEIFITGPELPGACTGDLHPKAIEGIELFNAGKYWEAHEALEAAWKEELGPVRHLYKGILQVGVMYLQIERANYLGMAKMYERCKKWLRPWPDVCRGVDVAQLRADAAAAMAAASALGPDRFAEFDHSLLRKVELI